MEQERLYRKKPNGRYEEIPTGYKDVDWGLRDGLWLISSTKSSRGYTYATDKVKDIPDELLGDYLYLVDKVKPELANMIQVDFRIPMSTDQRAENIIQFLIKQLKDENNRI